MNKFTPAADKRILILLAGLLWIAAGTILLFWAFSWLKIAQGKSPVVFSILGFALAMVIHHFGFLKVVDKNLGRILPVEGTRCIFAFLSWKSYIMAGTMMAFGYFLRHSTIPKPYLAVLYTGIGLSLILSSIRYLRIYIRQIN